MNKFNFKNLVGITSLFIASCAAYFSIIGIAMLFSGSKQSAIIMAASLELGKLVATSYLFRYWQDTKVFLKFYLTLSVLILMFITSLGIFGYLSASYQKSSLTDKSNEEKVQMYESKKSSYVEKISQSKLRIKTIEDLRLSQERRLSEAMTNTFIARNPIQLQEIQSQTMELISTSEKNIEGENKKIQESNDEIFKLNEGINQLKLSGREQSDIITFKFVADGFQLSMDKVVKWFISILISVFDPLAICLLLSYNNIIFVEDKKKIM